MTSYGAQIEVGENERTEFKSAFNQETVESVCAFANRRGGTIFLGVKSSDRIPGVQIGKESLQKWINEIKSKTIQSRCPMWSHFVTREKRL